MSDPSHPSSRLRLAMPTMGDPRKQRSIPMVLKAAKVRALAVLALAARPAGAESACGGWLNVSGAGEGSSYASGHGGDVMGHKLTMKHNSGFSITTSCKYDWDPRSFKLFRLLGRTLTYTVDLSKVGCACNLALYLVPLPARGPSGSPSRGTCSYVSYYCDANAACGNWCPELDVMQANKYVFAATPHKCDAPSSNGHYSHCDREGCGQNTNTMGVMDYGPGKLYTIDTTRPFDVHTDFYGSGELAAGAAFTGMQTRLVQGSNQLVLDHSSCRSYLPNLAGSMAAGMSLRIAYWGDDPDKMSWLDNPPCRSGKSCGGSNAGDAVISYIKVSSHPAGQWQAPTTHHPVAAHLTKEQSEGPRDLEQEAFSLTALRARVEGLTSQAVSRVRAMNATKLAIFTVGASALFCIPGFLAICGYVMKRQQQQARLQQQRQLSVPMRSPQHAFTLAQMQAQVHPARHERSSLTNFFGCCCRRELSYGPVGPYGPYYAETGDWGCQSMPTPRPQTRMPNAQPW